MKNTTFYIITDAFFKFILLFFINFIWCSYFINSSFFAIFLAILISALLCLFFNFWGNKKHTKKLVSIKEEQKITDITYTFIFMTTAELLDFFYKLVTTRHECKIVDDYIEIKSEGKPIILYPNFKSENITLDDILNVYKKIKHRNIKRFIVLTNKASSIDTSVFKYDTIILNGKETYYKLLKEYQFYPKITATQKTKVKNTFKSLLLVALNKKKSKGYFLSALFILFASFFVRYKIYYLVFSTLLLFLSLFSRFNISFNKLEKITVID